MFTLAHDTANDNPGVFDGPVIRSGGAQEGHMTKLIGVLAITALACASAKAQQPDKPTDTDVPPASQTNRQLVPIPQFKSAIEFPETTSKTRGPRSIGNPQAGLVISETQWVVKDGAAYIDILGTGTLIPLPGGGASGCFNLNLKERIAELRSRIEAFPPRPTAATPRQ
jgi:hypothetical protein